MKQNSLHRGMALLLAVCMTLTMNSGFAFAAEEPLPTETQTSREASVTDSGKEKLTDPMGSVTEGVAPSVNVPVCTCPPVDSGEVVHGEGCPLYAACTCPEGVMERYQSHLMDCSLYEGPSEEEFTHETVLLPDDHAPVETVDETKTRAARAVPFVGATYIFDEDKSSSLSVSRYTEDQPLTTIDLVINVTEGRASSDNIIALDLISQMGITYTVELNNSVVLKDRKIDERSAYTIAIPISILNVKEGENLVRIKFSGFGDMKCLDARILLGGGEQADKITKAFELQYYSEGTPRGKMILRSDVSGAPMGPLQTYALFFYDGSGNDFEYENEYFNTLDNTGSGSFTHTEPIGKGNRLIGQLLLRDNTNFTAYRAKQYWVAHNGKLNKFQIESQTGPQIPATETKPTHRAVIITPNPSSSQLSITGCTVNGKNDPSLAATAVLGNGGDYTFDWTHADTPVVTLSYTGMEGESQSYEVPNWSIDVTPPTFTTRGSASVLTRTTGEQLKTLLLSFVSNYNDAENPTPDAITVDISGVKLDVAGRYLATITAKDGMGNATEKKEMVHVENHPVTISVPTATPSGNDASTSRTFSAGITELGGQTFTERGFVLGFSPMPTTGACVEKITSTGADSAFTALKSGLLANVQLYVRAYAVSTNMTFYSDALAFSCGTPGDYGALTVADVLVSIPTGATTADAKITMNRPTGSIGTVTIQYETVVPTELQQNVTAVSGTLTFDPGVYEKEITIRINDAGQFNGVKRFQVKLTNPNPTTINGNSSANVTVSYDTANKSKIPPPASSGPCLLPQGKQTVDGSSVQVLPHGEGFSSSTSAIQLTGGGVWKIIGAPVYLENGSNGPRYRVDLGTGETATLRVNIPLTGNTQKPYAVGMRYEGSNVTPKITVGFTESLLPDPAPGATSSKGKTDAGRIAEFPNENAIISVCSYDSTSGTLTSGTLGSTGGTIPKGMQFAMVEFILNGTGTAYMDGLYFGVGTAPELKFTRFDSDIAAGRPYYPGDQIRIYPVLNSAVETPTGNILVNGTAVAYDAAQKAFVYTVPATGAAGTLAITHNGITYTAADGGKTWTITPTGTAGTFGYKLGALPTVSIAGAATGNNTTHSATVTATGGGAEYVWSASDIPPSGGWLAVPAGGKITGNGYTAMMYLHAKVTNTDGKTVYTKQSFSFVVPSVFEVSAAPSGWQKAATATLITTPATDTTLTVKESHGGVETTIFGNSYTIPESGVYTFTATDTYGFSKTVTRSYSIDAAAPVITVNTGSYTAGYNYQTLIGITATAKDAGGSQLNTLEYAWSDTDAIPTRGFAAVPSGGVVPAQNTPNTWYLHLKATDNAGNEVTEKKGSYLVTATAPAPPTVNVIRSVDGNTGSYTVTQGGNAIAIIAAPDKVGYDPTLSGSFNITKNGLYTVTAVDVKGIRAEKSLQVNDIDTDAPSIEASVWSGADEAVYGTYIKANSLTVKVRVDDKLTPIYDVNGGVTGYFGTDATSFSWMKSGSSANEETLIDGRGSFEVTENGEYEITAADAKGNLAIQQISIKSIDHTAPVITPNTPPTNGWNPVGSVVNFTVTDAESGIQSVTVKKGGVAVPTTSSYSFTTSGNGIYTITATDKVGNSASETVTVSPPATPTVVTDSSTSMTYGELVKVGVSATVSDGGTLTYQWYKGSSATDTNPSGKTPLGTTAAYAQPSSETRLSAGAHFYFCVVTNTKGGETTKATGSILVTVQKKTPDFTFIVDKNTAIHGETVKLTATVNAAPGGSTPKGNVIFKDAETVLATVEVTRIASGANTGHGEAVYNYAIPISHGEITATYTATANGNYNSVAPVRVPVTVNKKPLTIIITAPANLTYDEAAKAATLTGVDGLTAGTDYTLIYSPANPTDAGNYTATFALTQAGAEKYDTGASTLSVPFAITQAAGIGTVSCADIMFGGTVAPVPVSTTNGITNVAYLYKVKNADDSTYRATVPTNVGDYTVKATFAATTNYKEATATADFGITPAAVTGITVTPYTGVYDGEEHPIVTVTGPQTGDKVYYTIPSGSPTEAVPMVTKVADNMSVMVKVTRANHTDYAPTSWFSAKVEKKEVAATFTVPTDLVYDSNAKTVTATIVNKIGRDDVSLTLENATGKAVGKYTTTVTGLSGTAAGNYKLPSPAPEQKWEITGTPYPHEIVLPTASGITYGQKLGDSTLTGNNGGTGAFTWNDGAILPPAGSYTATVVFTPNDQNFAPVTRTVQVAVAKKDVTVSVSGTKAYHTPPIANANFVVSNITGMVNGETDVALLGTLTLTSDGNKQAAIVGSYDISVAQSGESNYSVTTTSVADGFTVTRAAQTLSGTASYQKLLTDKDFALDVKSDSTDTDEAVTYTLTNDGGGAVTLDADGKTVRIKKPGTATITANAAQTANFSAAAPLTITVTVGSNPAVRVLAPEGISTTGAKIGGTVTVGTVPMTGYGLEFKKSTDTDYTAVSPAEAVNGDVKTLTHTLAGLEKDTEYTVRVWAKTADKTFESVTRFRTAAEQPPTGKVEGAITDNSGTYTAITVTIEAGNTVIASHTVKAGGGTFTFEALPDGFYNLVADNGKYKVTRMVEIVKGGAVTDVTMEIGRTQSVVEIVTPDTPNVAVGGLPKLFENDALYSVTDKNLVENLGGTVEFKLLVEKKDTPADAEEIDKIAEGKVGVYLDIGLRKTVIDQNGREQESELVPDLGANEITIVIPLPKELQGKESYTVYRVHNGTAEKLDSTHNADGNTLTIQSSLFSTYAIAYTEKSGGTGGGSGGSSSDDGYDFWMTVKDKIQNADGGDVVKVNAKGYDKMPWSVMDALYKNDGVSLVITWNGKTITILAGKAQKNEPGRIYWPLSLLAELYADIMEDTVLTPVPQNPETGGSGKYIPVTGGDLYEMTAPMADQVTQPAASDNAGAIAPMTPAVITPPDAGFEPDTFANTPDAEAVKTNSPILWVVIAGMLTAAAVACGVWFWKRKEREQA